MNLNFNQRQIPDEELFFLMSQGNKQAQSMLFQRYKFFGRQIAGALIRQIRQESHISFTTEDFESSIDDYIYKIFRYYSPEKSMFYPFARDILNQQIAREVKQRAYELILEKEIINLDAPVNTDSAMEYHEVIGTNNQLSAAEQYDVDNFLTYAFSSGNSYRAKAGRIYTMFHLGFSIRDIAKKMHISIYKVRHILNEIEEGNIILTVD